MWAEVHSLPHGLSSGGLLGYHTAIFFILTVIINTGSSLAMVVGITIFNCLKNVVWRYMRVWDGWMWWIWYRVFRIKEKLSPLELREIGGAVASTALCCTQIDERNEVDNRKEIVG